MVRESCSSSGPPENRPASSRRTTIVSMKDEVLHGLLAARTLFDTARMRCFVRDRHVASAGLVILQDALELVLYSCLVEIGADEEKALDQLSFDQLIGELRQRDKAIVKSGTLKAMNKQRVLIKHHAQLAEPIAVQQYYKACALAADDLLQRVIGKTLQQVVIADAVTVPEVKDHITEAIAAIEQRRYFDSLVASRKALFSAVEREYDIRRWADYDPVAFSPPVFGLSKAPYFTRNRHWIQQNVFEATDWLQLDHDRIRAEMLEIGIDPEEFFNVWRLTPAVYLDADRGWAIRIEPGHQEAATEDNARYCLDVVVSIIRNQQTRSSVTRTRVNVRWRARIIRDQVLLARASLGSATETILHVGEEYDVLARVSGIDGTGEYAHLIRLGAPPAFLNGYVPTEACTIEPH